MKFVFPKNYKYNAKILGFIDYTTAIIDLIIGVILFAIIHMIFNSISTQISVFISVFFPLVLISVVGTNGENIICFFIYIIKFINNRKVYFYMKENSEEKDEIVSKKKIDFEKIKNFMFEKMKNKR